MYKGKIIYNKDDGVTGDFVEGEAYLTGRTSKITNFSQLPIDYVSTIAK